MDLSQVLPRYLRFVWISIEQSVMVSGIVHVFMGFVVRDWSCAVEFTNNRASTIIGHLIIFLILLKVA